MAPFARLKRRGEADDVRSELEKENALSAPEREAQEQRALVERRTERLERPQ